MPFNFKRYFQMNPPPPPPPNNDLEMAVMLHYMQQQQAASSSSRRRGSVEGRATIHRDHAEGHRRLFNDYFSDDPVYTDYQFRRRFRMSRNLFLRIVEKVESQDRYFVQRPDASGRPGLSSIQKVTAALRMLAYGVAADYVDEYVRIGESTVIEALKHFVRAVIEGFGPEYLRYPTSEDLDKLLAQNKARGFPGMIGSLDCMHWKWKNCPVAWKGMFEKGSIHDPTIVLEAVASYDLWIWHAFFGLPGSNNDINVLDRSPLFRELLTGKAPSSKYHVNGREYNMCYYLTDGIYPSLETFVKTIPRPRNEKDIVFAARQELARKDVERAFGVLQSRFAIVRGPARSWDRSTLSDIMLCCVVLHNMIVEDERVPFEPEVDLNVEPSQPPTVDDDHAQVERNYAMEFSHLSQVHSDIRDREQHAQLQRDLVEHLWTHLGNN